MTNVLCSYKQVKTSNLTEFAKRYHEIGPRALQFKELTTQQPDWDDWLAGITIKMHNTVKIGNT